MFPEINILAEKIKTNKLTFKDLNTLCETLVKVMNILSENEEFHKLFEQNTPPMPPFDDPR